jgi:hypothetical protein
MSSNEFTQEQKVAYFENMLNSARKEWKEAKAVGNEIACDRAKEFGEKAKAALTNMAKKEKSKELIPGVSEDALSPLGLSFSPMAQEVFDHATTWGTLHGFSAACDRLGMPEWVVNVEAELACLLEKQEVILLKREEFSEKTLQYVLMADMRRIEELEKTLNDWNPEEEEEPRRDWDCPVDWTLGKYIEANIVHYPIGHLPLILDLVEQERRNGNLGYADYAKCGYAVAARLAWAAPKEWDDERIRFKGIYSAFLQNRMVSENGDLSLVDNLATFADKHYHDIESLLDSVREVKDFAWSCNISEQEALNMILGLEENPYLVSFNEEIDQIRNALHVAMEMIEKFRKGCRKAA